MNVLITLQEAKKQSNKFGKIFFLKERIYLIQKTPFTDYAPWKSERAELHLALSSPDLKNELDAIALAAKKQFPQMDFKDYDDRIYVKLGKECGVVKPDCEIQFVIQIYGCFTQSSTGKTFLQMEITEHQSQKVSLLSKYVDAPSAGGLNYVPNSSAWEESCM